MLSPTAATVRLFLHVLAASVWVGGQIALAGVIGAARRHEPTVTAVLARAFARVASPAFAVLLITGLWSLTAVDLGNTSAAYQITVFVKIALAVLSAMFAVIHSVGRSRLALALGGALGLVSALGAMFLGILLHTA